MSDKVVDPEFEELLKEKLSHLREENVEVEILAKGFYQYEITEEALAFISDHPKATIDDLWAFFDANANGLAPGDDGEDLRR